MLWRRDDSFCQPLWDSGSPPANSESPSRREGVGRARSRSFRNPSPYVDSLVLLGVRERVRMGDACSSKWATSRNSSRGAALRSRCKTAVKRQREIELKREYNIFGRVRFRPSRTAATAVGCEWAARDSHAVASSVYSRRRGRSDLRRGAQPLTAHPIALPWIVLAAIHPL